MFLLVVILVFAATCCTARVIDVSDKQSAWERSGKFEGDIMLTEEQRNGLINTASRWPNRLVPFVIDSVFNNNERNKILLAIDDYHQKTDIRFKQYDPLTDRTYIHITGEDSGCWSYVGRLGSPQGQQLNLQRSGCINHGVIIHELLHALGFYHQQSATERDNYVTILWQNIQTGQEHNFNKYDASTITSFGVPYDYDSVMHYGPYAFSKNGEKTIEPKDPNAQIGQRGGFSKKDIEKLAKMYPDICAKKNAWEQSGKFEGDIMLSEEHMRNGLINNASRWPNREVPFVIDNVFTVDERKRIMFAIDDYHQKTPIRFKQYDPLTDRDYIYITGEDSGCWSYVGRIGGRQQLNLQRNGCILHGQIIHELLHALGFFHQNSASERDSYVIINWDNIEPGAKGNFDKYNASTITNFGVPYDYASVMHYGPCAFSKNGLPTIEPRDPNAEIGQREGFSAKDIEKLRKMYPDVCVKQSAWERSGKFEGDIMLTEEQRNGLINTAYRWPNGVVPYVIDDVFTYYERKTILLAIDDYHQKTTIRFKQYDPVNDRDYIHITGENSCCWSYVGRRGGRQQLNLQRDKFGCISHGTIIHELLHALGFHHQQSATERDDYVTINWQNIEPGMEQNFDKYDASTITSFGMPYDYDSVMHYGPCAFSKNGLRTIEPKGQNATIGQREGFSPKDIEKLAKMYPDICDEQSAWERSGKFEGDIMLTEEQLRNGLINRASRWPRKVVPYVIDNVFTINERNKILLAIDNYHQKTPIRFKQYNPLNDRDYIHITGLDTGCWSYVGRIGGRQQVNLQRNGCISHGTIIHELLHALGFYHQHSATERDEYVTINWENIEPGQVQNFNKYDASTITSFGVPYDYDSVMHYGPCAFSRNGKKTIVPKDPKATIGQRAGFSAKDIEKLEKMYENSSYASRSQFITLIIITLNVLTHLQ